MSLIEDAARALRDNSPLAAFIALYGAILIAIILSKRFRQLFFRPTVIFLRSFSEAMAAFVGVKGRDDDDLNSAYFEEILEALRNRPGDSASLSANVESEIVQLFQAALEGNFANDIRSELRLLVRKQFEQEVEHEATKFLSEVKTRLQAASSTVTVRGFVNLVFGIGFAGWALYLLKEAVETFTPAQLSSLSPGVALYLIGIRVSLALLITIISYFFLALYKRSLDEAKYYQNELTNISTTAAALQLAYYMGDAATKASVVAHLMSVDRNAEAFRSSESAVSMPSDDLLKAILDKIPTLKG